MSKFHFDPEDRQRQLDERVWKSSLKTKPTEAEVLRLSKQMEEEERKAHTTHPPP